MSTADHYIKGLKKSYINNDLKDVWNHFEQIKEGATKDNIEKIKNRYPNIPDSLIYLLEYVDGTYWREYKNEKISFIFLGSDIAEYPYYILSSEQILENSNIGQEHYYQYVNRDFDEFGVIVDDKITSDSEKIN